MGIFEDEYKLLNKQQQKAVDYIDGPLLVVAGPGTGKTQLLSMRVANIIKKTDTAPQNILCLTFTNKASLNMRERLIKLAGSCAKDVLIKTFHSFSAEVMNLHPDHFWNGANLTTVPETIQSDIIQSILGSLPLNDPLALRFAGKFTANKDTNNALRLTKEAGLTPTKLHALIKANLAYIDIVEPMLVEVLSKPLNYKKLNDVQQEIYSLPEHGIDVSLAPLTSLKTVLKDSLDFAIQQDDQLQKTTNTSKWKQSIIQSRDGVKGMFKERERNIWWLSLANVYKQYRNQLHKRGYYDYTDMIVEVISVLEQNAGVRSDIQERFQYVLIDEFQDSNAAQMRLAHLVADHESNHGKPNLMAVGDDDQSIYKFNGAELANMLTFQKSYPDTKLIVLTDNYRSSQDVLDCASKVIAQASDRLTLRDPSINKDLIAKNPPKKSSQIIHKSYPNQATQLNQVAIEIAEQYNTGQHSIAVLASYNDSLRRIASNLLNLKIPIAFQEVNNVLEHELIITVYQISALIIAINNGDTENVNHLLSQILRHPMWQLEPYDLWQLAVANKNKDWLSAMQKAPEKHQLFVISQWLLWLSTQTSTKPLPIILEYITGLRSSQHITIPMRKWYLDQTKINTDYLRGISALKLLLSLSKEFSLLSSASLEDFVAFIESAQGSGQIIADESTFITGENTVELLSIHKAKGLEFDLIYIIDAIDNNWKPKPNSKRSPINLPLQPAFDDIDDYIRLMYVAMTRAKRNITVCSYRYDDKNKEILATPLIESIIPIKSIKQTNKKELITAMEQSIAWPALSIDDEKQVLKPKLDNFRLSASALISFLDVSQGGPTQFKENYLLSLPSAKSGHVGFGNAVHSALELAQILTNKGELANDVILERFEQSLHAQNLLNSDFQRYLDYGAELIIKLLQNKTFYLPKGSLPEQSITDVSLNNVQLYGKLDRVDINNNELTIVDYKTGSPLASLFTKNQTKAIKAWRNRTQLEFYCLLAKKSNRFKLCKTFKGQIIYVEASSSKELVREYHPTNEALIRLEKLICVVWKLIKNQTTINTNKYSQNYEGILEFEKYLLDLN